MREHIAHTFTSVKAFLNPSDQELPWHATDQAEWELLMSGTRHAQVYAHSLTTTAWAFLDMGSSESVIDAAYDQRLFGLRIVTRRNCGHEAYPVVVDEATMAAIRRMIVDGFRINAKTDSHGIRFRRGSECLSLYEVALRAKYGNTDMHVATSARNRSRTHLMMSYTVNDPRQSNEYWTIRPSHGATRSLPLLVGHYTAFPLCSIPNGKGGSNGQWFIDGTGQYRSTNMLGRLTHYFQTPVGRMARSRGNMRKWFKEHNIEMSAPIEQDIEVLAEMSLRGAYCSASGLRLWREGRRAFQPSIDRKNSKRGYSLENAWIVSLVYNYFSNNSSVDMVDCVCLMSSRVRQGDIDLLELLMASPDAQVVDGGNRGKLLSDLHNNLYNRKDTSCRDLVPNLPAAQDRVEELLEGYRNRSSVIICEVLKLPLMVNDLPRHPLQPSTDRVRDDLPYVHQDQRLRIISLAANYGVQPGIGESDVRELVDAIASQPRLDDLRGLSNESLLTRAGISLPIPRAMVG
ncbi:MAG: hypothetical protein EA401_00015 [Planctomycetota bacterium]|nr:MAG: hypothetical protein EA401_00015 [Planctomycetota bacterium]